MTPASPLISSATQRNWAKLNTADSERLKSRANKSRSQKKIVPDAYIASSGLEPLIREVGHCDADLKDIMYSSEKTIRILADFLKSTESVVLLSFISRQTS